MTTDLDTTPDTEEDATSGRRSSDPELLALGRIVRILDDLDEPARCRAVAWLASRFGRDEP